MKLIQISPDLSLPIDAMMQRIMAKTVKTDGCWLWQGYTRNGYGCMSVGNRLLYLHRLMFTIHFGAIPADMLVCHRCDTRNCINPAHFFLGTKADNNRDAWTKGRASPPPRVTGMRHAKATLTSGEVSEIRCAPGRQRAIAARYGVSQSTVWRIKNGRVRVEG